MVKNKQMRALVAGLLRTMANRLHPKPAKPQPEYEPPSREFERALLSGGTVAADCELCGRTLYVASGYCMEAGELEELDAKHHAQPDKYIPVDYDSIELGHIDGRHVVLGCPCNILRKYEDFIWNERATILEYIAARNEAEVNAALRLQSRVQQAGGG